MSKTDIKVYPYRWVFLAFYFLISVIIEFQWLTFTSVSGEFFVHPELRYFSLEKIGKDQVEDYAQRKGKTVAFVEKFLPTNLNYI